MGVGKENLTLACCLHCAPANQVEQVWIDLGDDLGGSIFFSVLIKRTALLQHKSRVSFKPKIMEITMIHG